MPARTRPGVADALVVAGAALVVYGVTLLSLAAGVIVAGLLLAAAGVLIARLYG